MNVIDESPSPTALVKGYSTAFRPVSLQRRVKNQLAKYLFIGCFLLALVPLVSLLSKVIGSGAQAIFDPHWWTGNMYLIDSSTSFSGGVGHAIVGTLLMAMWASLIAVPLGVLTAIMLVEYPNHPLVKPTTFMVDILAGVPSIVAALFVFGIWKVLFNLPLSGFAVALALVLLMIPVVVRSTEEMLKLVPDELREASYALGAPKWKTIVRIVIPTALSGMVSGIFLAIARIMGETAPVLFLCTTNVIVNTNSFEGGMNSLPLYIKEVFQSQTSSDSTGEFYIWGSALTLILIIAALNLLAIFVAKLLAPKTK